MNFTLDILGIRLSSLTQPDCHSISILLRVAVRKAAVRIKKHGLSEQNYTRPYVNMRAQAERESYLRATNPGEIWKDINAAVSHAESHAVHVGRGGGLSELVREMSSLPADKVTPRLHRPPRIFVAESDPLLKPCFDRRRRRWRRCRRSRAPRFSAPLRAPTPARRGPASLLPLLLPPHFAIHLNPLLPSPAPLAPRNDHQALAIEPRQLSHPHATAPWWHHSSLPPRSLTQSAVAG